METALHDGDATLSRPKSVADVAACHRSCRATRPGFRSASVPVRLDDRAIMDDTCRSEFALVHHLASVPWARAGTDIYRLVVLEYCTYDVAVISANRRAYPVGQ
jgi:hypothetical protein